MPTFNYTPQTINDKSLLSSAWHPAMLVQIADEETPAGWQMAAQSPRLWRWKFAVWESPAHVQSTPPEAQSTVTSQKFSPGGKFQASKAFVFTRKLLAREIAPGESIDLDPMLPLPCQVLISRTDKNGAPIEYANIVDLQTWPEGQAALTPELKSQLAAWLQMKQAPQPQPSTSSPPVAPAAQAYQPPAPGMQSWAQPAAQPPVPAAVSGKAW